MTGRKQWRTVLAAGLLGLLLTALAPAGTIYVTPAAGGTGTGWGNPTSLTNALALAGPTDQIWMTGGTYSYGTNVTIASAATVVGGFAGTETTLAQRALTNALGVVTNYSAINGENSHQCLIVTANADVWLDTLSLSNTYPRRALEKSAGSGKLTLHNCRIEKNSLNGSYYNGNGNGVGAYLTSGTVLMTNCVVAGNRQPGNDSQRYNKGVGVYASGIILEIVDCVFRDQYSTVNAYGLKGSALGFPDGTLRVMRTEFLDNIGTDAQGGGALWLGSGASLSVAFTNCLFRGNFTPDAFKTDYNKGFSAAVYAELNAARSASFVNCTFVANTNTSAFGVGSAFYVAAGTVNLRNCILWSNECTGVSALGDEIYNAGGTVNVSYSDLTGTAFPYVHTTGGGSATTLSNCITNNPRFAGSGDYHLQSPAGRWENGAWVTGDSAYSSCIDSGDPADSIRDEPTDNGNRRINMGCYGGTAAASKSPAPQAPLVDTNGVTVIYDRAQVRGELSNAGLVVANVYICYGSADAGTTTGGWNHVLNLGEQRNTGPFAQWTLALTPSTIHTYRLFATNGNGSSWTAADTFRSGAAAPGGGTNVIHVDRTATGAGDGSSWPHACVKIMDGIAAIGGTRTNVWITGGSYAEGAAVTIASAAMVIGGFAGTETAVAQRARVNALGVVTNYTAINGENSHQCLIVTANADVWLDTLSVSNTYPYRALEKSSGSGKLTLNNCRIEKNKLGGGYTSGAGNGVGAYLTSGAVLMTNCVVAENRQPGGNTQYNNIGLGVYASGITLDVVDCVFRDQYSNPAANAYGLKGSALGFVNGTLRVVRTDFVDNLGTDAYGGGGALYLGSGASLSAALTNCLFRGNLIPNTFGTDINKGTGAGVFAELNAARSASFVNCTFAANTNASAYGKGGAIYLTNGTLVVRNCILWDNPCTGASSAGNEIYNVGGTVNVTYSDLSGTNAPYVVATNSAIVVFGDGMLTANPLFASATDLHLKSKGGRWNPAARTWVTDPVDSPCVDAGDPIDPIGNEPVPHGRRINMGAYGGTWQASKSRPGGALLVIR